MPYGGNLTLDDPPQGCLCTIAHRIAGVTKGPDSEKGSMSLAGSQGEVEEQLGTRARKQST